MAYRRQKGIRSNVVYSMLLTGITYLFPLIVYPYISRVLGVANIGLVGFIDSLVTYFILISMMGISVLGIREVARSREDSRGLRRTFSGLLSLHLIVTLVCLVVMAVLALTVDELRDHRPMMYIGMCKLVCNVFLVEWFFRGIEDFRYITLRSAIIRGAYVVCVFLFVRDSSDTLVYYALTLGVVVMTAAVNMIYALRCSGFRFITEDIKVYVRPFFSLGTYMLLAASYTTLNVVVLGFAAGDTEVGYYSTATKLFSILMAVYTALGDAVMPRMSLLSARGIREEMSRLTRKCIVILVLFALPVTVAGELFAPEIVMLLSGPGYEGAIVPLRIIFPFVLVFGIERLLVVQVLTAAGNEKAVNRITVLAAILGIVLNCVLVPHMGAAGSAIVWVACETLVAVLAFRASRPILRHS